MGDFGNMIQTKKGKVVVIKTLMGFNIELKDSIGIGQVSGKEFTSLSVSDMENILNNGDFDKFKSGLFRVDDDAKTVYLVKEENGEVVGHIRHSYGFILSILRNFLNT